MGNLAWRFDDKERNYINEVLDTGFASSTCGGMNTRLEEAFAKRMGTNFAVTFNSGTTTLHAAWALLYNEGSIDDIRTRLLKPLGLNERFNTESGICPNAETIQKQLMQFPTNQKDEEEMKCKAEALYQTIKYFS